MDFRWPVAAVIAFVVTFASTGTVGDVALFQIQVATWTIVFAGTLGAFQGKL